MATWGHSRAYFCSSPGHTPNTVKWLIVLWIDRSQRPPKTQRQQFNYKSKVYVNRGRVGIVVSLDLRIGCLLAPLDARVDWPQRRWCWSSDVGPPGASGLHRDHLTPVHVSRSSGVSAQSNIVHFRSTCSYGKTVINNIFAAFWRESLEVFFLDESSRRSHSIAIFTQKKP